MSAMSAVPEMSDIDLMDRALAVRKLAYAPYSGFWVGAAVLDGDGRVHLGCNVENAAYPEGICAEANALGSMVAGGGRRIAAIAVAGGGAAGLAACTPCGGCRQRIWEFADARSRVLLAIPEGGVRETTPHALLPDGFRLGGA